MISKNTVIAFLTLSAFLLGSVLVLENFITPPSARAGTTSRAGAYAVAAAQVDETTESLWLVDVDTQILRVFSVNKTGLVSELARVGLNRVFAGLQFQSAPGTTPGVPSREIAPTPETETETEIIPTEPPSRRTPRTRP